MIRLEFEKMHGENDQAWTGEVFNKYDALVKAFETRGIEFVEKISPLVIERQKHFTFDFGEGLSFQGYIDYLCKGNLIIDLKTASRSWPEQKELRESQCLIYPYALFKENPALQEVIFQYHIIILTSNPRYDIREVKVTRRQAFSFIEYIHSNAQIILGMQERYNNTGLESSFPGNRSSWTCSRSGCHVWESCEKTFCWKIPD